MGMGRRVLEEAEEQARMAGMHQMVMEQVVEMVFLMI